MGKEQVLKKPPKMVKKVVNEGKLFKFRQCDCHVLSQTKCFSKAHAELPTIGLLESTAKFCIQRRNPKPNLH